MTALTRRVAAALSALATLAALSTLALTGATPAAATAAVPAKPGGMVLESPSIVGETPAGFRVYVDPHALGASTLGKLASADVTELRRLGFSITYAGGRTVTVSEGIIYITTGNAGCGGDSGGAGAITNTITVPITSSESYMRQAHITVCPTMFTRYPSWELTPMLKHELGHALGLGHQNRPINGRYQIMRYVVTAGISDYQAGDVAALRWLAHNNTLIRNDVHPLGAVSSGPFAYDNNTGQWSMPLTGWALLRWYPNTGLTITLTRDGTVIARTNTSLPSPSVDAATHVIGNHGYSLNTGALLTGKHEYCVSASSPYSSRATTSLGCISTTLS